MVQEEFKELGLWKFAGAIMYIMQEVFGMPASRLIVPPNEKYGKFVLNEVLEAGNFGRHDERNRFGRLKLGHNLQRVYRDMRLVRYYPNDDWVDFLENVLPFDEQIIGALCSRGNQRDYFMQIIKRNSLEGVELENKNSNKLYQNILNGYSEQIKRYWMQM